MSKTYGEEFAEALACNTKEEAQAWLEKNIREREKEYGQSSVEARKIILSNLGYMAGYYDKETSQKVYDLFQAEHPIFGTPNYWSTLIPEEAFRAGQSLMESRIQKDGGDKDG